MTNVATNPKKHVPSISKERILKLEEEFTRSLHEQLQNELNKTRGVTMKQLSNLNDQKMKTINEFSNAKGNNRSKKVHRDEYIVNRYLGKKGHHQENAGCAQLGGKMCVTGTKIKPSSKAFIKKSRSVSE